MFTINQLDLIKNIKSLRERICVYSNSEKRCDCKYGITKNRRGESGCPELRQVIEILEHITDQELENIYARAGIRSEIDINKKEEWTEKPIWTENPIVYESYKKMHEEMDKLIQEKIDFSRRVEWAKTILDGSVPYDLLNKLIPEKLK